MSKLIYLEKTDIGATLTTWIYCAFWQMWAAEQLGFNSYIHWPDNDRPGRCLKDLIDKERFAKQPNMFEWYFKQPKYSNDFIGRPSHIPHDIWTWETWKDHTPVSFMAQPLSVIKDYYKKHLHFSDEVEDRGNLLKAKYKIDFSKTIGITWRGTDIYLESANGYAGRRYTPIELYYPWIEKALEKIPDARIACTAEEEGILDPLLKRYPQAFKIEEFYQAPKGSKHNPERFSPLSGFERGMQPALMVWLFSKCAWLIKNRASTSAVASWLSDGEIVNINHGETLGFPPHIDGVEYKGEVYL